MNSDELDSQLSAMFDDELPEAECELLARRLARDEALKSQWGRYALIGAAIRNEGGVQLDTRVARRVSAALSAEETLSASPAPRRSRFGAGTRWRQPVAGVAAAAAVAFLSLIWLREQVPAVPELPVAQTAPAGVQPAPSVGPEVLASSEPDSYTVPIAAESQSPMRTTALANYVVAHSEYSTPLIRRNLLTALVTGERGAVDPALDAAEPESIEDPSTHVE